MINIYKTLFDILTEPLGLPIHWIYEYIILLFIGEIAFQIAWKVSPGGKWGSEIHWIVRLISYAVMWAITYGIIAFAKWVIVNKILVISIVLSFLALLFTVIIVTKLIKNQKTKIR